MGEPTFKKLSSMHFYAWRNGLKTGSYYLRTKAAADSIKFTLNVESFMDSTDKGNASILNALSKNNEVKKVKKRVRVKKVKGDKEKENENSKPEEEEEEMACPRRKKGDDGPCMSCSG